MTDSVTDKHQDKEQIRRAKLTGLLLDLQVKLAQEAISNLDSRKISDLSGLMKADAAAAKVFREPKGSDEAKLDCQEIRRLICQEYGIAETS